MVTKKLSEQEREAKYNTYTSLKFMELSGAKLTIESKKELLQIEKELKACTGKKPVRTVNAAIGNEIVKLVEGIPVPASIEKIIEESKSDLYYFGK